MFSLKEKKYLDLNGTIRSQPAQETLKQLAPLFSPLGITRIANITGLDCLEIPVAISIRPNSKHLAVSQGKGLTHELAMTSAIMESVEGYHVENAPPPLLYGAYSELVKSYSILDPKKLASSFFTMPNLENWSMGWTFAHSAFSPHQPTLIPHVLTSLNSTKTHPEYSFLSVTTNGLAAGNTYHEALCHALYELIERDALVRWSRQTEETIASTQLKLDTISSEINQTVLMRYKKANQLINVWDITSNVGIPSFHCVIKDCSLRSLGAFQGTGTHLSKEIALSRALSEAAQSRLTLISGTRDDLFSDQYTNRRSYTYNSIEYRGTRSYQACYQPPIKKSFKANSLFLYSQLQKAGYNEIFIFDHTRKDFNIPVIQVFIPGLLNVSQI